MLGIKKRSYKLLRREGKKKKLSNKESGIRIVLDFAVATTR